MEFLGKFAGNGDIEKQQKFWSTSELPSQTMSKLSWDSISVPFMLYLTPFSPALYYQHYMFYTTYVITAAQLNTLQFNNKHYI
jgi:hypothetical protein